MHELIRSKYLFTVSIICISVMLLPVGQREFLYYNFEHASNGEYWRYISGHFTHYSWIHCISNLLGLYLIFKLFSPNSTSLNWTFATIFILCIISIGLAITSEAMKWYIGFSGVLAGLLSYACIKTHKKNAILSFTLLLALTIYTISQFILGGELVESILLSDIYASSYAHLFGIMSGCIYGTCEFLIDFQAKP